MVRTSLPLDRKFHLKKNLTLPLPYIELIDLFLHIFLTIIICDFCQLEYAEGKTGNW